MTFPRPRPKRTLSRPDRGRILGWGLAAAIGACFGVALRQMALFADFRSGDVILVAAVALLAIAVFLVRQLGRNRLTLGSFFSIVLAIASAELVSGGADRPNDDARGDLAVSNLDGRSYRITATCTWTRNAHDVASITAKLPGGIGTFSGAILVIDFNGSSVDTLESGPQRSLAGGPGALDNHGGTTWPVDRRTGTVVLDGSHGSVTGATFTWDCRVPVH